MIQFSRKATEFLPSFLCLVLFDVGADAVPVFTRCLPLNDFHRVVLSVFFPAFAAESPAAAPRNHTVLLQGTEDGRVKHLLHVLLSQCRTFYITHCTDFTGLCLGLLLADRSLIVLVQLNEFSDIISEVTQSTDQNQRYIRELFSHLRNPFFVDVVKGRRVDDAEAE